jgi:hypothetical protein
LTSKLPSVKTLLQKMPRPSGTCTVSDGGSFVPAVCQCPKASRNISNIKWFPHCNAKKFWISRTAVYTTPPQIKGLGMFWRFMAVTFWLSLEQWKDAKGEGQTQLKE